MAKGAVVGACMVLLAAWSTGVSAQCDAIEALNIPSPLTSDTTIEITGNVECPEPQGDDDSDVEEFIIVEGGTLTLYSSETVRFVNLGFVVMPGASLVFDMPKSRFGPNAEGFRNSNGFMMDVEEGATAIFKGKLVVKDVSNVGSLFRNSGLIEMEKVAYFERCNSIVQDNFGTMKFRGISSFIDNQGIAIANKESGFIRFSKATIFDDNGNRLEGFNGVSVENGDADSTIVFAGDAVFKNHSGKEGVTLFNRGNMRFNGKASFDDNTTNFNGGAARNFLGSMMFKGAVQFNNNEADEFGGGIAVEGGDVTFQKGVLFSGNMATSGGAFVVTNVGDEPDGTGELIFGKTNAVRIDNNIAEGGGCTVGEVEAGAVVTGFPDDDVCVAATV